MLDNFISFDFEATGLQAHLGDRPFLLTLCDQDGVDDFVRADKVDKFTRRVKWDRAKLRRKSEVLRDPSIPKIAWNVDYDHRMADYEGIEIAGDIHDGMAMWHLLKSGEPLGLKPFGVKYLEVSKEDEEDLEIDTKEQRAIGEKKGWNLAFKGPRWGTKNWHRADYWLAAEELCNRYGLADVGRLSLATHLLVTELMKIPSLWEWYLIEMQIWKEVTKPMIDLGVRVDPKVIALERWRHKVKHKSYMHKFRKSAGREININSPKQLRELFYEDLGFPVKVWTKGGRIKKEPKPSTGAQAMLDMDHPTVKFLSKARTAQKALTSFFDRYKALSHVSANGDTLLHPNLNQFATRTLRYSCKDPNIQNAADARFTRSLEPIQARSPFIPREGCIWEHVDWSQIEMWIFNLYCQDENLRHDLMSGNLHVKTANRVFGKGRDIVAEELARGKHNSKGRAKMLNFGVVFGMGLPSTANFLGCGEVEAKEILDRYHNEYKNMRPFMWDLADKSERDGFVETPFGFRIQVDPGFGFRATNYKVQSTAGAHMKTKALWEVRELAKRPELKSRLILTMHDELARENPNTWANRIFRNIIKKALEDPGLLYDKKWLPTLPVTFAITDTNWGAKRELK